MTAAERALLRAAFRWARAEGIDLHAGLYAWSRPGPVGTAWGIYLEPAEDGSVLEIWRSRTPSKDYWVTSVAEAVDVLVAIGILPHRFSTAYRAGWDASYESDEHGLVGDEYRAIVPAVDRELVRS